MNPKYMNFQKKTLLVLAVLLAAILIYVVAFALPIRRKIAVYQEELVQTERQIREQKDLSGNREWMEQEIEDLPYRLEDLPEYNNQKNEMKELKEIFDGVSGYGLEFQTEKINETLIARDVTVTFEASGIEILEEITGKIEHGTYPSVVLELSMKQGYGLENGIQTATPSEESGSKEENENYSCIIRIRYFEKVTE